METVVVEPVLENLQEELTSLHQLVSGLVSLTIPRTVRNRSFFVNDVPAILPLFTNPDLVATVLSGLITIMATQASNTCIRISARENNKIITLELSDQHNGNMYTVANSLQPLQPLAGKIGGYLGICCQKKNSTTIIFSFLNSPVHK